LHGTNAETEIEGLKLQGELFWLRASGGAPQQLLGVSARRIVQQETVLFDEPLPAAHLLALFFEDSIVIQDGTALSPPPEIRCAETIAVFARTEVCTLRNG